MVLFILRKLILQTRMRSKPVGLDAWYLVGRFVCFHTSCVRTAKPEPSLVAYVISTIIAWAGSNDNVNRGQWANFCGKFQWNQMNHSGVTAAIKQRLILLEQRLEKCKVIPPLSTHWNHLAIFFEALISVWNLTKTKFVGYKAICQNSASSENLKLGSCAFLGSLRL